MTENQREWRSARDELVTIMRELGFPKELGEQIARELGSPKAIRRMSAYLAYERPRRVETVVDEMLAIRSDIERWKEKKASEEANRKYNEMLNRRRYQ